MSADNFALTTAGTRALGEHLLAASERRQPIFWIALALAATVHFVALVGIGRSVPRSVGDPNGATDAIDVEIVDASALHKDMGLPSDAGPVSPQAPAVPPPQPPQAEQEAQPEPQPEQPTEPEQAEPEQPPQEAEALAAQEAKEAPKEAPKEEPPKAAPALPAEEASPDLPAAPKETEETAKKAEKAETKPAPEKAEAKPKPKPPAKRKSLDLSMPTTLADELASPGSEGQQNSGFSRPPGITRSGENDRFGRDVLRALKRSMPRLMNVRGRCTIRIILNKRGNVASVKLVKGSGDRGLDGEVLFAAGQTSYPFPPKDSSEVDRTFLITYIYN